MKRICFLLLFIVSTGCVTDTRLTREIDETVSALIDTEIRCSEYPEGTCAIDSRFHALAAQARDVSTRENPQHFVSLLDIGQDALLARLHLIRAARDSIDLQTYIWVNDEVGRLMFYELLKAARRGVKVRIIADQLPVTEDPALLARLATAHENLQVSFYNPTFSRGKTTPFLVATGALFSFRKINQRMHNKVFIVDNLIGIAGGRNIENKYYDYDPTYSFKDRDILVIGPAVGSMTDFFEQYWNSNVVVKAVQLVDVGKEVLQLKGSEELNLFATPDPSLFSDIDNHADSYSIFGGPRFPKVFLVGEVTFTADLPGKSSRKEIEDDEGIADVFREVVTSARESITIQTPYFVLSRTARQQLRQMRKQNPGLRLTVSTNSLASTDVSMIYGISFKQKREIVKNLKMDLYEFRPFPGNVRDYIKRYDQLIANYGSESERDSSGHDDQRMPVVQKGLRTGLHAKSLVVDSKVAVIGSHNFDPRSANINTESIVIIRDEGVARALEQNILQDTEPQNSWIIVRRETVPFISRFSELIGGISQMLPIFDVWPFRYTSSFQLKEGMDPLPPSHPDFYKHYEDVGQFPEVNLSVSAVQTRLIKSFGGFTEPLM